MGITLSMIEKDMIWHNDHHQQAIRDLTILQQQLFNQRIERKKYYRKNPYKKMMWNKKNMMIGKTWRIYKDTMS